MVTKLGKFLRMLRLDRNELLKDMAEKLSITPSYLSSIENGKRTPSFDMTKKLDDIYNLSKEEHDELYEAFQLTVNEIKISLSNATEAQSDLGTVFARRLNELSNEDIESIRKILIKK